LIARMMLADGAPVLRAHAVLEMTSDQVTAEQKGLAGTGFLGERSWGFCQSVVTDGPRAGAFGWDGGHGTSWLVNPERDLTVIVLIQRPFETQLPKVHADLQEAAYAALPVDCPPGGHRYLGS